MDEIFEKRLRAAVGAGWRTVVIWAVLLTVSWLFFLLMMHARPEWVRYLWGGSGLSWEKMQEVAIWFYGAFKIVMLVFAMIVVFLALWLRRLSR